MTDFRKMWLETLLFKKPERVFFQPGFARESTMARWHADGMPAEIITMDDVNRFAYGVWGGEDNLPIIPNGFYVNERMIPQYEETIIAKSGRNQIVQDWKGNICEIGGEFSLEHLRNPIDFVTRRWIKCPVESRSDWEDMKTRYNPAAPERFPQNTALCAENLKNRPWPIELHFSGPFWQLREWLGFEQLCMMLLDAPDFVAEMIDFWRDYIASLLRKTFSFFVPDGVHLSEDMAYKNFAMISPAMTREFFLPTYQYWGEIIRNSGCPIYSMDSDGYIGELIPIWIEAGINVCDPIEVAAGNDINALRGRFGKNMAFRGGIDKRAMAQGGSVLYNEIKRVEPIIKDGGYIPGCDHGIPSDISWPNYIDYVKLLAISTGWL